MPRTYCVGNYRSNYDTEKETIKIDFFPKNAAKHDRWEIALPNILSKTPAKDILVCVQHCHVNYKNYKKKGHQVPVDPLSIFLTQKSFVLQGLDVPPRNPERKYIDYEPRLKAT